jgi:hypothetical protein
MEKRDYLEREIEKMPAVLQKIFGLRVDKPEEAKELISTEMNLYFHLSQPSVNAMDDDEFVQYIHPLKIYALNFLGDLLFASVDLEHPLSQPDKATLHKVLIVWETWELKTKTLDWEKLELKKKIKELISPSESK